MLDILYEDDDLIAINKPHGLLVHRSSIAANVSEFALQLLRDQIQQIVFPAHRLDRKTGGVLLFSRNREMDSLTQQLFANNQISKIYWAIVRGYTDDEGTIDYPLRKENGVLQDAVTHYRTISRTEINIPFGKHATSRYSFVEVKPQTGRMHQIRKHLAHIFHPIIADRPHGCNKQNKLWKEQFAMETMMLHARGLTFKHPRTLQEINIEAPPLPEFIRVRQISGL